MFVGRPFHLDYSTALLFIADAWKQKAQGIPPGCFLLAYYDNESLQSELSMRLHTAEEEANNPTRADKQIEDAFRRVREYLRDKDPKASGTTTTSSTVSPETCSGAGSCGHSLQPPEHCLRSSTESKRRMAH
jgi:hypothetical protein